MVSSEYFFLVQTNPVTHIANLPSVFMHLTAICNYQYQTKPASVPPHSASVHLLNTFGAGMQYTCTFNSCAFVAILTPGNHS